MYTIAWKHRFDKNVYWYFDAAQTVNKGNAHYDLGAGGRGLTNGLPRGTNTIFIDYSSAGPRPGAVAIRSAFRPACTTPSSRAGTSAGEFAMWPGTKVPGHRLAFQSMV